MPTLQDWVVELQFDNSKVIRGLKELEKKLKKYEGKSNSPTSKPRVAATKAGQKDLVLLRAQNSMRRKMNQASSLGLSISKQHNVLNKGSVSTLRKRAAELDREIIKRSRIVKLEKQANAERKTAVQSTPKKTNTGSAPYTRLTPITNRQRTATKSSIDSNLLKAENLQQNLSNNTDKTSINLKKELSVEIAKLNNLKKQLAKTTYRNSAADDKLNTSLSESKIKVRGLSTSVRSMRGQLKLSTRAVHGFQSSLKNMARSYISVFAAIGAVTGLVNIGRRLEDTGAVMLLASGNAKQAAIDLGFVKDLASQVKIRVADLSKSFAKFAVAGKTSGMSIEKVKENFTDLSIAIRSTGLSQDQANLAFLGFQQMLAGPVVQAQEMNQIIEQMPQFAGTAAAALKEMGMEADNYRKAIATGTVDSKEFIGIVSRLMREDAIASGAFDKAMASVTAGIADMNIALDNMGDSLFKAGLRNALVSLFKGLKNVIVAITPVMSGLVVVLNVVIQVFASLFNALSSIIEAFGVENGATGVVLLLAAALTSTTIPAIVSFIRLAGVAAVKAWSMASGITGITLSVNKLKWAMRGLAAATGIGALYAIGSILAERGAMSAAQGMDSALDKAMNSKSSTAGVTNSSTKQVTVNQTLAFHGDTDIQETSRRMKAAWNEITV